MRTMYELSSNYLALTRSTVPAKPDLERHLDDQVRHLRRELLSGHLWNTEEITDAIADLAMTLEETAQQFLGKSAHTCVRDKISRKFNVDPDQ